MKTAIIDGNNIVFGYYQQMFVSKSGLLNNSFGTPTTIIFGLLRSLNSLTEKLKVDECVVCWDVGGSKYRKNIWADYKAERKKKDPPFPLEDYYAELDEVRDNYIPNMGIKQAIAKGIEADDVIGFLSKKLSKTGKVVIVSNDKDYYQLASRKVHIFRPITDELLDGEDVSGKFDLPKASLYTKMLALTGDKDEVPGIYRLGEKTAVKLLEEYNWSLKKLVQLHDKEYGTSKESEKKRLSRIKPSRFTAYKLARIRTKLAQYDSQEKKILKNMMKNLNETKAVKASTIEMFEELFEMKTVSLRYVLRNIGVKLGKDLKVKKKVKV